MFPRFYFLGDDDLLEVLGQSTSPSVIQSHLKKLFAGKIGLSLARTYCVPGSARHSARLGGKLSNRMRVPPSQRSWFSGKTACCVDSPTALPAAGTAELWSGWRHLGAPARWHGWRGLQNVQNMFARRTLGGQQERAVGRGRACSLTAEWMHSSGIVVSGEVGRSSDVRGRLGAEGRRAVGQGEVTW